MAEAKTEAVSSETKQRLKVVVSQDSMSASVLFLEPATEEKPFTQDEIMHEINDLGIVFGIDNEAIVSALENIETNKPIIIVSGLKPEKGTDAKLEYHFNTSNKRSPKEGTDGHIDYHDLSYIQNTTKGFVLVSKTPHTEGKPGKNIFGKAIQNIPGRDVPFKNGTNTTVSEDGLKLIAATNGAIIYRQGNVSVQEVLIIDGDVDFSVGNLDCGGSLKVSQNIKPGFVVSVDGDLEVAGNVEDASITCKGNVLIKGGCFGGKGFIKADGDITVKFAESQRMEAGGEIEVGGEIINCQLVAGKNIRVGGSRGKIIGGEVKAETEIRASVLGSDAGTATHLMVGYDAELMEQYRATTSEITRITEDSKRIKEVMYTLYRLEADGKLPPEKKAVLSKLEDFKKEIPENLKRLESERAEIEKKFEKFKDARIVAEERLFPGVRASFGVAYKEIIEEQARCQLTYDGQLVSISSFDESAE